MKPAISRVQRGAKMVTCERAVSLQKKCCTPQKAGLVTVTLTRLHERQCWKVIGCGPMTPDDAFGPPGNVRLGAHGMLSRTHDSQFALGQANQPFPSMVPLFPVIVIFDAPNSLDSSGCSCIAVADIGGKKWTTP